MKPRKVLLEAKYLKEDDDDPKFPNDVKTIKRKNCIPRSLIMMISK